MQTVTLTPDQARSFKALGAQVQQALVGKLFDQALLDQVKAELSTARAAQGKLISTVAAAPMFFPRFTRGGRRPAARSMLALALLGIGLLHPSAAPGETKPGGSGIPICLGNGGLPELPLTATITDSVGQALSRHNHRVVARTDSLYRAGRFGRPGATRRRSVP